MAGQLMHYKVESKPFELRCKLHRPIVWIYWEYVLWSGNKILRISLKGFRVGRTLTKQ